LKHAQKQQNHNLSEFDTSVKIINERCAELVKKLKTYSAEALAKREREKHDEKSMKNSKN
jgi:hypothetical protein